MKRYFIAPLASLRQHLDPTQELPRVAPLHFHAHHLSDGVNALVVCPFSHQRGGIHDLPTGWKRLPPLLSQQPLPSDVASLLSSDYGITATDTTYTAMLKVATHPTNSHHGFHPEDDE